jgi:hypothetical protein
MSLLFNQLKSHVWLVLELEQVLLEEHATIRVPQ